MKQCTACRRHVRPAEGTCPFCGEVLRTTGAVRVGAALLLGALGASCTTRPVGDTASGGASTTSSTGDGTTTTGPQSTTTTGPASTTSTSSAATTTTLNPTTGEQSTTNDVDTTDPGCSFYGGCPSDFATPTNECDLWLQDCPVGEKCMPWSADGDNSWESFKCTPVAKNPGQAGELCTVEGSGVSGVDSCDISHMCWNPDPDTLEGICIQLCTGSIDMPVCDPGSVCSIGRVFSVCFPNCHPIMQDCADGDLCIPNPQNSEAFLCAPDASGDEGQEFDPCEFHNACDPGLTCQDSALATECDQQALGCCLSFCDTTMPTCTGENAECVPWYGMGLAPPGYENVGLCAIP